MEIGEKSMKALFSRHSISRRCCNRRLNFSNTLTIDQLLPKHKGYDFYVFNFKKLLKSTMKYHLTPTSKAIKKKAENKCGKGSRENGTLIHCWWACKIHDCPYKRGSHFQKQFLKRLNIKRHNIT